MVKKGRKKGRGGGVGFLKREGDGIGAFLLRGFVVIWIICQKEEEGRANDLQESRRKMPRKKERNNSRLTREAQEHKNPYFLSKSHSLAYKKLNTFFKYTSRRRLVYGLAVTENNPITRTSRPEASRFAPLWVLSIVLASAAAKKSK